MSSFKSNENIQKKEGGPDICFTDKLFVLTIERLFSLLQTKSGTNFGHIRMYVTSHRTLDDFRFGTVKFYRQIVYIPMGTICAPLVADVFLFC